MQSQPEIRFIPEKLPSNNDPTPWFNEKTKSITNPMIRFHNEVIDFFEFVSPGKEEHEKKQQIFRDIQGKIHQFYQGIKGEQKMEVLNPLFEQKIYMKGTELEIYAIFPQVSENAVNKIIEKIVEDETYKFCSMASDKKIDQYRIIIEHSSTQTIVWINFVSLSWKPFFQEVVSTLPSILELKYLYLVNHCMIRQRGLHHNIKNILILGLCQFFMFERRRQRVRTLSENFIKFLEYFGVGSMGEKKIIFKAQNQYECLINPEQKNFKFIISGNLDLSTAKIKDYFKFIQNRYRIISNYYYAPGVSVLAHLLNPSLGKFYY